ncbi:hypothetical protein [Robiginitalea aurantiaca]|uniref:Uncharacterized protein n=1 Tax=Robiginitalea aurantiaca TaxID=3056915 RepID=A0ABT7WFB0_9FLAO|nr:hypothetical protein [Robiginitalea aurantiaca]MDM9631608.1 hypothetical protein [Robiginitalea aurantiaca]
MPKERRKYGRESQPRWAKEHYSLNNCYATDIDGIQLQWTENATYAQYQFRNDDVSITKIIEVKHHHTQFVSDLVHNRIEPTPQIKAFLSLVEEINMSRSIMDKEEAKFFMVVQTEGNYPFHVFDVFKEGQEVNYHFIGSVENEAEYKKMFEPSS